MSFDRIESIEDLFFLWVMLLVEEYRYVLEMNTAFPDDLDWFEKWMILEDIFLSPLFAPMCPMDPNELLDYLWNEHRSRMEAQ